MKEEEKYKEWLAQVKQTSPVLTNPEKLTEDILLKISHVPQKRKESSRKLLSWGITIAAGFLLLFLVHETYFYPESKKVTYLSTNRIDYRLPDRGKSPMTAKEKRAYLSELWKERKKIVCRTKLPTDKMTTINFNH